MTPITTEYILMALRDGGKLRNEAWPNHYPRRRLFLIYDGRKVQTQFSRIDRLLRRGDIYSIHWSGDVIEYKSKRPWNLEASDYQKFVWRMNDEYPTESSAIESPAITLDPTFKQSSEKRKHAILNLSVFMHWSKHALRAIAWCAYYDHDTFVKDAARYYLESFEKEMGINESI